jgi:TonB family protein
VDRWLALALAVSLTFHGAAMAVPFEPLPKLHLKPRNVTRFIDAFIVPLETTPDPPLEPPPNLPEPSPPPPPALAVLDPVEEDGGPRAPPKTKRQRKPPPDAPTEKADARDEQDPRAHVKSISVSNFKVSGLIEHLPTVRLAGAKSSIRGGASIVRGDGRPPAGIVTKHGASRTRSKGRLPPKALVRVVNANANEIERCYNASLKRQTDLHGRLEIEWVVDKNGTVSKTRIIYDDIGSPSLQRCVRAAVQSWVFPPPVGGSAVVSFPFQFTNLRR